MVTSQKRPLRQQNTAVDPAKHSTLYWVLHKLMGTHTEGADGELHHPTFLPRDAAMLARSWES